MFGARKGWVVAVVVMGLLSATLRADEPSPHQLMQKIEQLQARVQELEAQRQAPSPAEVDATLRRVFDDAQRRSQLLQAEGFTAGYSKGKFLIQSADGNFVMNPNVQFQFRYAANYAEDIEDDGDDDLEKGFEVRRLKFGFSGNLFSPELKYDFVWATSTSGTLSLEDAFVTYAFAEQWAWRIGQFKTPVFHEELISGKRQLAADRSLLNELLGGGETDRVQGVALLYGSKDNPLRATGAFHDGVDSDNSNFTDAAAAGSTTFGIPDPEWGVAGRAEYKFFGDWKAYDDFTALGNKESMLIAGAGADWTQQGSTNVIFHSADVQWENAAGLGIYGAFHGVYSDPTAADTTYNWGALGQLAYLFTEKWEVFGRYGWFDLDDDLAPAGAENQIQEITGGVNYYWHGHAAKFTLDVTYLPDGSPSEVLGVGVFESDDAQLIVRGQFQLLL